MSECPLFFGRPDKIQKKHFKYDTYIVRLQKLQRTKISVKTTLINCMYIMI